MLGVRPEKIPDQRREWIGPAPYVATDIPGPNAAAVLRTRQMSGVAPTLETVPIVARRANGSVIEDVDGNRFLDFTAALTAGPLGHAHPKVVARGQDLIATMSISGTQVVTAADSQFGERLASCASETQTYHTLLASHAGHVYETAMGLARRSRGRKKIVAFHPLADSNDPTEDTASGVVTLDWPFPTMTLDRFKTHLDLAGVRKSDIAAIVLKPFASMRACDQPDAAFADALVSFCQDHAILLVFDETFSGMGRTGSWFVCRQLEIAPDMILVSDGLAGGLPLGALLVHASLAQETPLPTMTSVPSQFCCAIASTSLEVIASMQLDHVAGVGEEIRRRLERIAEVRRCVGHIAGSGLLQSIEVVNRKSRKPDAKRRNAVLRSCLDRGLLLAPIGTAGIFVSPAACINNAQLDVGCRVLEEALALLP